jgi:hypothetical protein
MKRILGAVAAIIALAAIIFVWQPWERRRTVQLPPSRPTTARTDDAACLDCRDAVAHGRWRIGQEYRCPRDALASSEKEPDFLDKDCEDDAQAKDIYRGMMLSFAGYLLVMTDLRSGDYENYGFVPEDHSQIDAAPLLAHWSKERVTAFWHASNALGSLPGGG